MQLRGKRTFHFCVLNVPALHGQTCFLPDEIVFSTSASFGGLGVLQFTILLRKNRPSFSDVMHTCETGGATGDVQLHSLELTRRLVALRLSDLYRRSGIYIVTVLNKGAFIHQRLFSDQRVGH
jgi:hypothetical protein